MGQQAQALAEVNEPVIAEEKGSTAASVPIEEEDDDDDVIVVEEEDEDEEPEVICCKNMKYLLYRLHQQNTHVLQAVWTHYNPIGQPLKSFFKNPLLYWMHF